MQELWYICFVSSIITYEYIIFILIVVMPFVFMLFYLLTAKRGSFNFILTLI